MICMVLFKMRLLRGWFSFYLSHFVGHKLCYRIGIVLIFHNLFCLPPCADLERFRISCGLENCMFAFVHA